MGVKAIHNFEHAVHSANEWLKELASQPEIQSEEQAYTVLRVVLHALRDRLRLDEVVAVSAQLPMLIRGFYFEGWKPQLEVPRSLESPEDFLDDLAGRLIRLAEVEAEDALYLVYALLAQKLTEGDLRHVENAIPLDLVNRWRPGLPLRA